MAELHAIASDSLIIADSGSAEAILRYLETPLASTTQGKLDNASQHILQRLQSIRFVLIDPPDIYTAGERHGRDFRFSSINQHCRNENLMIVSASSERRREVHNLAAQLDVKVLKWTCDDDMFEKQLFSIL